MSNLQNECISGHLEVASLQCIKSNSIVHRVKIQIPVKVLWAKFLPWSWMSFEIFELRRLKWAFWWPTVVALLRTSNPICLKFFLVEIGYHPTHKTLSWILFLRGLLWNWTKIIEVANTLKGSDFQSFWRFYTLEPRFLFLISLQKANHVLRFDDLTEFNCSMFWIFDKIGPILGRICQFINTSSKEKNRLKCGSFWHNIVEIENAQQKDDSPKK